MKHLSYLMTFLFLFSSNSSAHLVEREVAKFWDGTFMYNQIRVTETDHSDVYYVTVSGTGMGIGQKIAGSTFQWPSDDSITFSVKKTDCELDEETNLINCQRDRLTSVKITWNENSQVTKTFNGTIFNIQLSMDKNQATLDFQIKPNENFQPVISAPSFRISSLQGEIPSDANVGVSQKGNRVVAIKSHSIGTSQPALELTAEEMKSVREILRQKAFSKCNHNGIQFWLVEQDLVIDKVTVGWGDENHPFYKHVDASLFFFCR